MDGTRILLVRHGHTRANDAGAAMRLSGWTDLPLSPLGEEQAARVAARLASERAAVVYTSPLRRARVTAERVAARQGAALPVRMAALREIHCGWLEGWAVERVQREHPELWARNLAQQDDGFAWPGGETYGELRARALRATGEIAARHRGATVVVVTHAGVVGQLLGSIHGLPPARWEPFRPGNGSLTVLEWAGSSGRLLAFDDRDHLAGLEPERPRPSRPAPRAG